MLKTIEFNDEELKQLQSRFYNNDSYEGITHPYIYNGENKVIKIFNNKNNIENKIKKIKLIKERTKNIDFVATADFLVSNNNKIIGYGMPYIKGKELDYGSKRYIKNNTEILKELSKQLKELHKLNIIAADFSHNFLVDKNNKVTLIDHDNFAIDDLKVDSENNILKKYIKFYGKIDDKFDNYLLNLLTISVATRIHVFCLYKMNNCIYINDNEIQKIINNTLNLNNSSYNEDIIIDKVNNNYKKIKKIKYIN